MKNNYAVKGDVVEIEIPYKDEIHIALIDKDDFDEVASIEGYWRLHNLKCGYYAYFFVRLKEGYQRVFLHRMVMGSPKNLVVDHINHKTLDNRKDNLRRVTIAENVQNVKNKKKYHVFQDGIYRCRVISRDIKIDRRFKSKEAAERFGEKMNELLLITDER